MMTTPSDSNDITNADRAAHGELCIQAVPGYQDNAPDQQVIDALANIVHYCHREGLDFQYLMLVAVGHFREEIQCGRSICPDG